MHIERIQSVRAFVRRKTSHTHTHTHICTTEQHTPKAAMLGWRNGGSVVMLWYQYNPTVTHPSDDAHAYPLPT